jgi:hypothetical protein
MGIGSAQMLRCDLLFWCSGAQIIKDSGIVWQLTTGRSTTMSMDIGIRKPNDAPTYVEENDRRQALLAWVSTRVEQLANQQDVREPLGELLDWVAYFTREHFGFQQRLLNECSQRREYALSRMATHSEFRKRLATICVDIVRCDPTVPERLRALCSDLRQDAQSHDDVVAQIVCSGSAGRKLRKKPRRPPLAANAVEFAQDN